MIKTTASSKHSRDLLQNLETVPSVYCRTEARVVDELHGETKLSFLSLQIFVTFPTVRSGTSAHTVQCRVCGGKRQKDFPEEKHFRAPVHRL